METLKSFFGRSLFTVAGVNVTVLWVVILVVAFYLIFMRK